MAVEPDLADAEEPVDDAPGASELRVVELSDEDAGERIDKALAAKAPELSRARIQALLAEGRIRLAGAAISNASMKAQAGTYEIEIPPPAPAEPQPENI